MRGGFQVSTCANSVPRPQFQARTCIVQERASEDNN